MYLKNIGEPLERFTEQNTRIKCTLQDTPSGCGRENIRSPTESPGGSGKQNKVFCSHESWQNHTIILLH